jgi:CBS domain-containing protein
MYGFVRDVVAEKGSLVFTVGPSTTVRDAVREMNEHGVGAVLVIRGRSPVGIFTERDVLRRVVDAGMNPAETRISEVMTTNLVTVTPNTPVDQAMAMMTRLRCRHFPVLDDGQLGGMVSAGDLMRWVQVHQEAEIDRMAGYITGRSQG